MTLVVLAVAAVAGGAFLLLGGDDERSPEETVRDIFDAALANDCETIVDLYTRESWSYLAAFDEDTPDELSREDTIRLCRESAASDEDDDVTITLDDVSLTSQEGDRAVLEVTSTEDGEQSTDAIVLTREEGGWRVDLPATDELASGDAPAP